MQLPPVWTRDPELDTESAWAALQEYRDLPRPRPELKAFAATTGRSYTSVLDWSSRCVWAARIAAYDQHMDRKVTRAAENEAQKMGRRHVRLARALQDMAATALEKHKALEKTYGAATAVNPRDAIRAGIEGAKLERLVRGLVTDRTGEEIDYSKYSDDELEQLKALLEKGKPS